MDTETIVIAAIVVLALFLLLWLPARKHWNSGGEVDDEREQFDELDRLDDKDKEA